MAGEFFTWNSRTLKVGLRIAHIVHLGSFLKNSVKILLIIIIVVVVVVVGKTQAFATTITQAVLSLFSHESCLQTYIGGQKL